MLVNFSSCSRVFNDPIYFSTFLGQTFLIKLGQLQFHMHHLQSKVTKIVKILNGVVCKVHFRLNLLHDSTLLFLEFEHSKILVLKMSQTCPQSGSPSCVGLDTRGVCSLPWNNHLRFLRDNSLPSALPHLRAACCPPGATGRPGAQINTIQSAAALSQRHIRGALLSKQWAAEHRGTCVQIESH